MSRRHCRCHLNKQPTEHHRLPKALGGTDTYPPGNIVIVRRSHHEAWHSLFDSLPVERIVELLNEIWLDPRVKLVITKR